jgi:hypothetical protein
VGGDARLGLGVLQDGFDVGVEAHAPQADVGHELLGRVEQPVAAKHALDEGDARVGADLLRLRLARLALRGAVHLLLAGLEQLLEAHPQPLARLEEVLGQLAPLLLPDALDRLVGAPVLPRQLDEQQPHVAGEVRHGRAMAVAVAGPVVDPLAERVGVEDGAEQRDGLLGRVPVLEREAGGDVRATRVLFGGHAGLLRGRCLWFLWGGCLWHRRLGARWTRRALGVMRGASGARLVGLCGCLCVGGCAG